MMGIGRYFHSLSVLEVDQPSVAVVDPIGRVAHAFV
jgi:hypothetical protein